MRLTERMMKQAERRAAEVGLSRAVWMRAVIAAALLHPRRFGDWVPDVPGEDGPSAVES